MMGDSFDSLVDALNRTRLELEDEIDRIKVEMEAAKSSARQRMLTNQLNTAVGKQADLGRQLSELLFFQF